MGATNIDLGRGRLSGLRATTLALIVERPGHGYELWSRLNRRLGPTWKVEAKQIYPILNELEAAGLVVAVQEPGSGSSRQPRTVYHATPLAADTLRSWIESHLELAPRRPAVIARIAAASPGDARALLRVLDDYETELLRVLEANDEPDPPVRSWSGLVLALARGHTDTYLQGELQWVAVARRRIREFLAAR